ncbi:hypothetical protein BZG21_31600 [Escherichia coli]|nr:hypothetical protein [Escherichia coli]
MLHAVDRKADQQGDHAEQAEPCQQGDLPLDGQAAKEHGRGPCTKKLRGPKAYRQGSPILDDGPVAGAGLPSFGESHARTVHNGL